jgi:dihydropteroate synthase
VKSTMNDSSNKIRSTTGVMGILNLTDDSFSDGGLYASPDQALVRAQDMVSEGASIIDVGAESTRPGARSVPLEQEWARLEPVLEKLVLLDGVIISVDTQKKEIMRRSLALGVGMINSVNALGDEGAMSLIADSSALVCLMHMHKSPETMQKRPLGGEEGLSIIISSLEQSVQKSLQAGIQPEQIILDPGFGFGKSPQLNWMLISRIQELRALGYPLLLGASRKSSLGLVTGKDVDDRLSASVAVAAIAVSMGYDIIRAHDVAETYDAYCIAHAIGSNKQGD